MSPGVWGAGDEGGTLKCGGPGEDFIRDVGTGPHSWKSGTIPGS